MNISILGISVVKWTRMGRFNSDEHYIYYCGQESLRKNGVMLIIKKRVWNAVLRGNLKNNRMTSVHFQSKPFNITVIQVYTPITNAEEDEVEWFYEDLQEILKLIPQKDVLLITGDWNAKVKRDTWSNRQIWPWSIKWSRAKANRVWPRQRTGQHTPSSNNISKYSIHGHHWMVNTKIR